jgi:predicted nucleic acid-binding protein
MNEKRKENVRQKRVLDSFTLLAYLNREAAVEKVRNLLAEAQRARKAEEGIQSGPSILMNEINVGETYYILSRTRGAEKADYFLETILPGLPISVVSNGFEDIIAAARIKAEHPLSFADCFAVMTAQHNKATIITGDPEFKTIKHLVKVEWLR